VSARWVAALFAAVILFGFVISARAQDRYWQRTPGAMCVADEGQDAGHAKFHEDFYRKWLRPDTGTSCCNMRVEEGGHVTGDCRPRPFRQVAGGHWEAQLEDGSWIPLPDDKSIREKNPDPSGVDGHLCQVPGMVYCWVPPTGAL